MELVLSNDIEQVRQLVAQGFCPVECSFGGESIVDDLEMDHHGALSHREAVGIRAYRDYYGVCRADPRFVVAGSADADATFTIAALAALLPHPSRAVEANSALAGLSRDLSSLAQTIARVDVSPIGLDIPSLPGGDLLLTWNVMAGGGRDTLGLHLGVGLWRALTETPSPGLAPFLEAAKSAEINRRAAAQCDLDERGVVVGKVLLIQHSRVSGFASWYGRIESEPFTSARGWQNPIVLAHQETSRSVTIGCPNLEVAEELFGAGGLLRVFPLLQPSGWGGREAIGGSPRGAALTTDEAQRAAETVSVLRCAPQQC